MKRRSFLNLLLAGAVASETPAVAAPARRELLATLPQLPVLEWLPRSDWISVKSTGAAGDGTADDTAALQAAFSLIKRGVTVYFPPGVYRVTRTLVVDSPDKKALYSVAVVGHGRESRLIWDGPNGEAMIRQEGMGYSRWIGLDLDGAHKAGIGQHHYSRYTFETVHRKQHMAFRNFVKAGVYADPGDAFAMAETSFENCLFDHCGTGVSFTQFNDYDITLDGCDFQACGIGVECVHGNFYIRNSHFESSTAADIVSQPEHGSSVRRCTSMGSAMFIKHANGVAVLTIEGCAVGNWGNAAAAITMSGAPAMVFDCAFSGPPAGADCAIRLDSPNQRLISSQNSTAAGLRLFNKEVLSWENVRIYEIPAGRRRGIDLRPERRFFKSVFKVPGRVFDAKRDFGAMGNGANDDTAAVQNALDAARDHGQGAMAYLPAGEYVIKDTLRVYGSNYYFGGAGLESSILKWMGRQDGVTIAVDDPDHIVIEHMGIQKREGIGIRQATTGRASHVVYDGLFVASSNTTPVLDGLQCVGLTKNCTVVVPCVVGNLRFIDCGAATIVVQLSYYGTLTVEGRERDRSGLLGMLTRFSGGGEMNVVVKNNQNIVMSDFYSESSGNVFRFEGDPGDPPGRITIQAQKLHLEQQRATNVMEVRNYAGQIFFGPSQFYAGTTKGFAVAADRRLDIFLLGNSFYGAPLRSVQNGEVNFYRLGNVPVGKIEAASEELPAMFADNLAAAHWDALAAGLDDLRRLGETDLRLNHP